MAKKDSNPSVDVASGLKKVSYFELHQRINSIKRVDTSKLSIDQIKNRVARIIDQSPIQPRELLISGLYRARKNQDNKLFLNAKDLWYPPSHCVEKLGRLNDIGESKFYASSMPNTTILELKPAIGDVYTIISAKTHDDNIKSIKIAFIGIERSKSFDTKHLTQNDMLRYSKNFRKTIGESNYKKWIAVDDYLSQILAIPILDGEEHKYKPSVAFAKLLAGCYGHKAA